MYTPADKSQFQAWTLKRGTYQLSGVDQEIVDWISKQFGVHVLDFSLETRKPAKGHTQQLVHLIMDSVDGVKKLQAHAENARIAERFMAYLKFSGSSDPLKCDRIFVEGAGDIIVTYRPLKEVDKKIVEEIYDDERRAFLKSIGSVWTLSQSVVFYHTDAQVKENQVNGISNGIVEGLHRIEQRFEPGKLTEYRFDSKECFDRDYESNWYYYWK